MFVALFRPRPVLGSISKTNPALLRWRDPVYRTLRELAYCPYLHDIREQAQQKTLRKLRRPFDLRRFDPELGSPTAKNCWDVGATLDDLRTARSSPRSRHARCACETPWSARQRAGRARQPRRKYSYLFFFRPCARSR